MDGFISRCIWMNLVGVYKVHRGLDLLFRLNYYFFVYVYVFLSKCRLGMSLVQNRYRYRKNRYRKSSKVGTGTGTEYTWFGTVRYRCDTGI
ncbi:hypothetical protein HanRHA438_Chr04g0190281 [Helianthus annuus]|uniref:Uncharacterized protein n=1 Tax=Helianthus annuus TaxID=4232 RepID=A0A9K3NTH8_HELAN|nr:hypothetical protein HanXRQr2_Chr04g0180621 [Helianthus annuus]KAJ0590159.1 hypothetical protein HanIR_Chr04g0194331 [Helianthus annuus]KAJ0928098.1 hypothetical protein HanRHA438_Chr04g0190281 [Helianthus annuus]KAJ0932475.1 hypothetical protein HanPSC8_Chr04g0174041 [Helianthus annuus]